MRLFNAIDQFSKQHLRSSHHRSSAAEPDLSPRTLYPGAYTWQGPTQIHTARKMPGFTVPLLLRHENALCPRWPTATQAWKDSLYTGQGTIASGAAVRSNAATTGQPVAHRPTFLWGPAGFEGATDGAVVHHGVFTFCLRFVVHGAADRIRFQVPQIRCLRQLPGQSCRLWVSLTAAICQPGPR